MTNQELIYEIVKLVSDYDVSLNSYFVFKNAAGEPFLSVNCNDTFYYACADSEDVTVENFPLLKQTYADCKAADPDFGWIYADLVFAARCRKYRPLQGSFPKDHPEICKLLESVDK